MSGEGAKATRVKRRAARLLVQRLSSDSDQIQTEALCELRLMTKHDPDSRPLISDAGAVPLLLSLLSSPTSFATVQENAIATLLNLSISSPHALMSTPSTLTSLLHLLRHPSTTPAASSTACTVLLSLLSVESYRPIIGANRALLSTLLDVLRRRPAPAPAPALRDALRPLFAVALYPLNRPALVQLGAVPALLALVVQDGHTGIVEDATAVLAQVAGCEDSVEEFRRTSGVRTVLDLVEDTTGSSPRVRENAVAALLNLVQCGGDRALDELRCTGASLAGITELAESGTSRAKAKASALLQFLSFNGLAV